MGQRRQRRNPQRHRNQCPTDGQRYKRTTDLRTRRKASLMVFYKFWVADGICEKQFVRNSKELTTIDGTTYWDSPTGKRFEVWGVEKV